MIFMSMANYYSANFKMLGSGCKFGFNFMELTKKMLKWFSGTISGILNNAALSRNYIYIDRRLQHTPTPFFSNHKYAGIYFLHYFPFPIQLRIIISFWSYLYQYLSFQQGFIRIKWYTPLPAPNCRYLAKTPITLRYIINPASDTHHCFCNYLQLFLVITFPWGFGTISELHNFLHIVA